MSLPRHAVSLVLFVLLFTGLTRAAEVPSTQPVWSNEDTSQTPVGHFKFNGPFCRELVTATREIPEKHDFVQISFDLLIIRSWDGSVPVKPDGNGRPAAVGPDFMRVSLRGGPTLLYTTFCNNPDTGFRADALSQNYPSPIAGDLYTAQSAAIARNSLGYTYAWTPPQAITPMDATYHIHFVVPHSQSKLVLELEGMNLQDLIDEAWGVMNLKIDPMSEKDAPRTAQRDVAAAFKDAATADSETQPAAMEKLILGMDDTANWIKANVKPQSAAVKEVKDLIANLAADDLTPAARDAAAVSLRQMGPSIEPLLRDARREAPPEQRIRLDWLLQGIAVTPIDDEDIRRFILATRTLEIIGTPRALDIRHAMSEPGQANQ